MLSASSSGEAAGSGATATSRRSVKLTKYSFYDDAAEVVVLVELDESTLAAITPGGVTTKFGAEWVELALALPDHDAILRLSGLTHEIVGASAKKGKSRVTLRLAKADTTKEWHKLLSKQAEGGSFTDDD